MLHCQILIDIGKTYCDIPRYACDTAWLRNQACPNFIIDQGADVALRHTVAGESYNPVTLALSGVPPSFQMSSNRLT